MKYHDLALAVEFMQHAVQHEAPMTTVKFKGAPVATFGELPKEGNAAPKFVLTRGDLSEAVLEDYGNKRKLLNVFPSLDTSVCAASVRKFNEQAAQLLNKLVLHISMDLPFAQARFCQAERIGSSEPLSAFRSSFPRDYGVLMTEGPLKGLLARSIFILDENNQLIYKELVDEITHEPNYGRALMML
jgi:thiol peroxidase